MTSAGMAVEGWTPTEAQGGTQLMVAGLRRGLGAWLQAVDLHVNSIHRVPDRAKAQLLWIHHDINIPEVQWLHDQAKRDAIDGFIFVSDWQRARFVTTFGIDAARSLVLRNATDVPKAPRPWQPGAIRRIAYTSVPYRGLSVLLDAWCEAAIPHAELHVWSAMRLYGPHYAGRDADYQALYARAQALDGVVYHGVVPNDALRRSLATIDFLAYPCIFAETSCLAAIEAMSAGCRIICPSVGALPETTHGFAREYSFIPDPKAHARHFARLLREELDQPWAGRPERCLEQQAYAAAHYDWSVRLIEWKAIIGALLHTRVGESRLSLNHGCLGAALPFGVRTR